MKTTLILFVLPLLFVIFYSSCNKQNIEKKDPATVTFTEPGLLRFDILQESTGMDSSLSVNSMKLSFNNQSVAEITNIRYSIRGFQKNKKEFKNLSYWIEDLYPDKIPLSDTVVCDISKNFDQLISKQNIELDLLEIVRGNDTIKDFFSGVYDGTFRVQNDSLLKSYGQHYSWINYAGFLTTYFDRREFPWISLSGQITTDTIFYGKIIYEDTIMDVYTKVMGTPDEMVLKFNPDTTQNNQFTIYFNQK